MSVAAYHVGLKAAVPCAVAPPAGPVGPVEPVGPVGPAGPVAPVAVAVKV